MRKPAPYRHDEKLGYAPIPGHVETGVAIDADGCRSTGQVDGATAQPVILALGNSFTYGEDVADLEAWPAQLQRLLGRPVRNGGVSGYGFDQIVLRAERLGAVLEVALIVVGFIADDVRRTEFCRLWWRPKPWFSLAQGEIVLNGVPVPKPRHRPPRWGVRRAHEALLGRLTPALQHAFGYHVRAHRRGTGEAIGCCLTRRLAALQSATAAPVIVVAFYDGSAWLHQAHAAEQRRITGRILDCARRNGLGAVDSFATLAALRDPRTLYNPWHMNAAGHQAMARLIAAALPQSFRQSPQ